MLSKQYQNKTFTNVIQKVKLKLFILMSFLKAEGWGRELMQYKTVHTLLFEYDTLGNLSH